MSEEKNLWPELERLNDEYWKRFIYAPEEEFSQLLEDAYEEARRTNQPMKNIPSDFSNAATFKFGLMMFDHDREQEAIDLLKSILAGERGPLTEEEVGSFAWPEGKYEKMCREYGDDVLI